MPLQHTSYTYMQGDRLNGPLLGMCHLLWAFIVFCGWLKREHENKTWDLVYFTIFVC